MSSEIIDIQPGWFTEPFAALRLDVDLALYIFVEISLRGIASSLEFVDVDFG
jgi:hypothetical protein